MKCILGKKMSMTQVWVDDKVMAVTPVLAGPCTITQIKTKESDGYGAIQLAFGSRKEKNVNKPQRGHVKSLGIMPQHMREFRMAETADLKAGDVVSVDTFTVGDTINVTGTSKGKGFQGVVKRHGFHGFRKTHGNKDQERMPGSIGPKGPAHVFKGTRMGGRMGGDRVTTTNLEVIQIDTDNNIIFVKGAIPGAINGLIMISGAGDLQVNSKKAPVVETPTTEVAVETPVAEIPTTEVAAETPVAETPVAETPVAETPVAETPVEEQKEENKEEQKEENKEEQKEENKEEQKEEASS